MRHHTHRQGAQCKNSLKELIIDQSNIDLKPSNILLELDDSKAVVSRYIEQTPVRTTETDAGSEEGVIATPLVKLLQHH